uniref:Si:ch211-175m2.5 n=1 Tax=Kryptolebias marmoratus TaxID=37003 RepID=A0A3Q3AE29_KRYMA
LTSSPSSGNRLSSSDHPADKISRYPVPNKKDLPYDIVEIMEEVETKGGFLPNVFKVLSHRPAEFRSFFTYYNELMNKETGSLTKADRELIIVVTSTHNKCPYCVVSHSALHRIYSKKPSLSEQVIINYKTAELSPREVAMLDFAMAVCRCDIITEEHFRALEEAGFDREDAWDIGSIAAFFAMSNRLAHITDMKPNEEFFTMGRMPRDRSSNRQG